MNATDTAQCLSALSQCHVNHNGLKMIEGPTSNPIAVVDRNLLDVATIRGPQLARLFAEQITQQLTQPEFEQLIAFLRQVGTLQTLPSGPIETALDAQLQQFSHREVLLSNAAADRLCKPGGSVTAELGIILHCQSEDDTIDAFWDPRSATIAMLKEKGIDSTFCFGYDWHWRAQTAFSTRPGCPARKWSRELRALHDDLSTTLLDMLPLPFLITASGCARIGVQKSLSEEARTLQISLGGHCGDFQVDLDFRHGRLRRLIIHVHHPAAGFFTRREDRPYAAIRIDAAMNLVLWLLSKQYNPIAFLKRYSGRPIRYAWNAPLQEMWALDKVELLEERVLSIEEYAPTFLSWAGRFLGQDPELILTAGKSLVGPIADCMRARMSAAYRRSKSNSHQAHIGNTQGTSQAKKLNQTSSKLEIQQKGKRNNAPQDHDGERIGRFSRRRNRSETYNDDEEIDNQNHVQKFRKSVSNRPKALPRNEDPASSQTGRTTPRSKASIVKSTPQFGSEVSLRSATIPVTIQDKDSVSGKIPIPTFTTAASDPIARDLTSDEYYFPSPANLSMSATNSDITKDTLSRLQTAGMPQESKVRCSSTDKVITNNVPSRLASPESSHEFINLDDKLSVGSLSLKSGRSPVIDTVSIPVPFDDLCQEDQIQALMAIEHPRHENLLPMKYLDGSLVQLTRFGKSSGYFIEFSEAPPDLQLRFYVSPISPSLPLLRNATSPLHVKFSSNEIHVCEDEKVLYVKDYEKLLSSTNAAQWLIQLMFEQRAVQKSISKFGIDTRRQFRIEPAGHHENGALKRRLHEGAYFKVNQQFSRDRKLFGQRVSFRGVQISIPISADPETVYIQSFLAPEGQEHPHPCVSGGRPSDPAKRLGVRIRYQTTASDSSRIEYWLSLGGERNVLKINSPVDFLEDRDIDYTEEQDRRFLNHRTSLKRTQTGYTKG